MPATKHTYVPLIIARPASHEVAIVPLDAGDRLRVRHPDDVRDYTPDFHDLPSVAVIPGDRNVIGWGWSIGWYGTLTGVRNGHHEQDRDAWHAATSALKRGGVAYVAYVQRLYYGEPRWTANGYRWEPASRSQVRLVEKAGASA